MSIVHCAVTRQVKKRDLLLSTSPLLEFLMSWRFTNNPGSVVMLWKARAFRHCQGGFLQKPDPG